MCTRWVTLLFRHSFKRKYSTAGKCIGQIKYHPTHQLFFKDKTNYPATHQIGFSAQEIEKEFPELIKKDDKGLLAVNYPQMSAVAIEAIKEQQQQIEALKALNNQQQLFNQQLLSQNELLIKRLEKLEQK